MQLVTIVQAQLKFRNQFIHLKMVEFAIHNFIVQLVPLLYSPALLEHMTTEREWLYAKLVLLGGTALEELDHLSNVQRTNTVLQEVQLEHFAQLELIIQMTT